MSIFEKYNKFLIINFLFVFASVILLAGIPTAEAGPDSICIVTPQTHEVTLSPGQSINVTTDIECSSFAETFTDIVPDLTNCGEIVLNDFGARFLSTSPGFIKTTYTDTHTITYNGEGGVDMVTCDIVWSTQGDSVISTTQTIVITIVVPSDPILEVSKHGNDKIRAGTEALYHIEISNTGNVDLVDCIVIDDSAGVLEGIPLIEPGQVFEIFYELILFESYNNRVIVECIVPDNGEAIVVEDNFFTVVMSPDISIEKTSSGPIEVGEAPEYEIRITNTSQDGFSVLTGCTIIDNNLVPPLIIEGVILGPGESFPPQGEDPLRVTGPVLTTTEPFTNTAHVECFPQDDLSVTDSASIIITPSVPFNPAVDIVKTSDVKIVSGSDVHFEVEVVNVGDVPLYNCEIFDDQAGVIFAPFNLTPGENTVVEYFLTIESGPFVNTAFVICEASEDTFVEAVDESHTEVINPAIFLDKSCDSVEPTEPGTIIWVIEYGNIGDTTLTSTIEDEHCSLLIDGFLEPGTFETVSCIDSKLLGGTYTNSVTFTAVDQLGNTYEKTDSTECTIEFSPFFRVEIFSNEIENLSLPQGTENSLLSLLNKLQFILNGGEVNGNSFASSLEVTTLESNEEEDPCDLITAIINKIQAQSGKKIEETKASELIEQAEFIQELLECDTSTDD